MGRIDAVAKVHRYAEQVVAGKVVAGSAVRAACERHLRDLAAQPARGFYFDEKAAAHAIEFFSYLKHSKGEWAGERFTLEAWQCFIVGCLFGWMEKTGVRRFTHAYIEVPRKNGKSTLAAGVGLYLFAADGEPGAEVYTAGTKRDQARIPHGEAIRMVKKSRSLRQRIRIRRDNLSIEGTASKYEPLGADQGTDDGLNPHGAIIDELHAHKTSGVVDVLTSALGARRQPLIFRITTAGYDQYSVCREEHEHSEAVLNRTIEDDSWFAYIATIDEGDNWASPKSWRKANPNYGVSVRPSYLRDECARAKQMPSRQNTFRRLHLDEWTAQEERWIPLEMWDATAGIVEPAKLRARECYGGLDLSSTTDLTAFLLDFPPEEDGGLQPVLPFFWLPGDDLVERSKRDRVPYDQWVREGLIQLTEGNVVDYDAVRKEINRLGELYDIREIAFDRWGAHQVSQDLDADGFTVVPMGQGYVSMSPPTKEFEKLVLSARICHGGHKVLRWMADCVTVRRDPHDNMKPVKPDRRKSSKRIDGIVALIMALDRAIRHEENAVEWASA